MADLTLAPKHTTGGVTLYSSMLSGFSFRFVRDPPSLTLDYLLLLTVVHSLYLPKLLSHGCCVSATCSSSR